MRILPECAPSAATPPGRSSLRLWGSHLDCDSSYPAEQPPICWSCSGWSCGAPCALCCRLAYANPVRYRCQTRTRLQHHLRPRGWPPSHPADRSLVTLTTTTSSRGLDRGWTVGSGYRGHQGESRMRTPWCYRTPRPTVVQPRGRNHRWDSCCLPHHRHFWTHRRRTCQSSEPIGPFCRRCSIGVRDHVWGRFCAPSGPPPRARPALPLSGLIRHCLLNLIGHCSGEIGPLLSSRARSSLSSLFPFSWFIAALLSREASGNFSIPVSLFPGAFTLRNFYGCVSPRSDFQALRLCCLAVNFTTLAGLYQREKRGNWSTHTHVRRSLTHVECFMLCTFLCTSYDID